MSLIMCEIRCAFRINGDVVIDNAGLNEATSNTDDRDETRSAEVRCDENAA